MKKKIIFILKYVQLSLLTCSYFVFKIINQREIKNGWVIGVDEIASVLFFTGNILQPSTTVCLGVNKLYKLKYDYSINVSNKYIRFLYRVFYGPILLGYLANKNSHFLYIWNTGFLINR